jgi:hypothetical protein
MTTIPTVVVTPSTAAEAYNRIARADASAGTGGGFGDVLTQALGEAVQTGHKADEQAMKASGNNITNRYGNSGPHGAGISRHHENANLSHERGRRRCADP